MKVLIISEAVAPVLGVASIRWTKIPKYMKLNHPEVHITVLTDKKDYEKTGRAINYKLKDILLEKEMIYYDEYWEIPHGPLLKLYYFLKGIFHTSFEKYNRDIRPSNSDTINAQIKKRIGERLIDFKMHLISSRMKYMLKNRLDEFDVVVSGFGPVWTIMVAEYAKKKAPHLIWLADFRDCYAIEYDSKPAYERHKKFTMKHCACADAVVRVVDSLMTFTPPYVPVYTIPNGFDPQEGTRPQPPDKFRITYTGLLYRGLSDIGIAYKALCELCYDGLIDKNDVEFVYAGPSGMIAREQLEIYHPQENFLIDRGMLQRTDVHDLQVSAAILLQSSYNGQRERALWTGKMFEYMMAQKPILYVMVGDVPYSEPSKQIHHLGGYCYEQCRHKETWQGMKDYILEKYQEWKATGNVSVHQDKEYIEQYSYPHIAEQVWQLIQTQMERRILDESTTA